MLSPQAFCCCRHSLGLCSKSHAALVFHASICKYSGFLVSQAFTRCAQQEPDNGEAWNNIAAIHLQLHHSPEAFSALSEAVKYKRDSWQTWSNYGQAAAQTGNGLPAARAVQKARLCLSMPLDFTMYWLLHCCMYGQAAAQAVQRLGSACLLHKLCKRQDFAFRCPSSPFQVCFLLCFAAGWCTQAGGIRGTGMPVTCTLQRATFASKSAF